MLLFAGISIAAAILLIGASLMPTLQKWFKGWEEKKEKTVAQKLDKLFYEKKPFNIVKLYILPPLLLGAGGLILFKSLLFAVVFGAVGLAIPGLILKAKAMRRRQQLSNQILDTIMIISSSLKSGLSILQSLEIIVEEMPAPISQEMGLLVRENKMGVTLEDSLKKFKDRVAMDEYNFLVNSILVARETGGDLPKVLSRLTVTIRDNRKIRDSISTLTTQGRLQGIIMSVIPLFFAWWVMTFNKNHFDIMLRSQIGRVLLAVAIVLQILGIILIRKFSTIKI